MTQPKKSFYEESLDLEIAGDLMNEAVGRVVRKIYDEEKKGKLDEKILQDLYKSLSEIADDRRTMRGEKPHIVEDMIEKYRQKLKNNFTA